MRRSPRLPSPFGNRLMGDVLAACAIHGWSQGSSRFGPALPFLECYVLYAGGSSSALDQFFPDDIGLHLSYPGSAPRKWFHKRLHVGLSISARQTFLDVVALQVARPPWPFGTATQRPRAFTFELSVDSSPPRQSSMLPGRLVDCRGWSFTSKKGSRSRLHIARTSGLVDVTRPYQPAPGEEVGAGRGTPILPVWGLLQSSAVTQMKDWMSTCPAASDPRAPS
jgi:hypothetical protein